ncbi:Ig-like domain-containing protein [Anaerovorax odorimutans]|uniref:Ig-like domain-containing protein n=1 Tax=Anaerovorax odorimutans TaxID=109327 RepID=UPI00042A46B2|nr:Ig-like domain-containing protein [Anaerovorax odorimutans]
MRNNKNLNKILVKLSIVLCMLLCLSFYSFAEGGNGDGSGGGRDIPVGIASSNITDGQVDVPIDTQINLEFNKNVINISVAENNKSCFTLVDNNDKNIGITVVMGDDQIDPSIRRLITVIPDGLEAETKYTLTISKNFTAKNGVSLKEPIILSFTTEGKKEAVQSTNIAVASNNLNQKDANNKDQPEQPDFSNIINKDKVEKTDVTSITEAGLTETESGLKLSQAGIDNGVKQELKNSTEINKIKLFSGIIIIVLAVLIAYVILKRKLNKKAIKK